MTIRRIFRGSRSNRDRRDQAVERSADAHGLPPATAEQQAEAARLMAPYLPELQRAADAQTRADFSEDDRGADDREMDRCIYCNGPIDNDDAPHYPYCSTRCAVNARES